MTWFTNSYRFGGPPVLTREFGPSHGGGAGNAAMQLPSGNPGQLLIAHLGYRDAATFTAPAGWTIIHQVATGDTSPSGQCSILKAYKIRGASEPDPTFTRTGGGSRSGYVVGYTPNRGTLALGGYSNNDNGGGSSTTKSTGGVTSTAALSLITATIVISFNWTTPKSGLSAASMGAAASSGVLVDNAPIPVGTEEWWNLFYAAYPLGSVVGTQGFDVLREGAGASGTISVSGAPNTSYQMEADVFDWSIP